MTHYEFLASEAPDKHETYYSQFVTPGTKQLVLRVIGKEKILASTDKHFNDIPLAKWDAIGSRALPLGTAEKLREKGDYLTLAGTVCILKQAAKQIREESIKSR